MIAKYIVFLQEKHQVRITKPSKQHMHVIKNQSSKVVVRNEHNIDDDYGHHVCACTIYTRTVALTTAAEHSVHITERLPGNRFTSAIYSGLSIIGHSQ